MVEVKALIETMLAEVAPPRQSQQGQTVFLSDASRRGLRALAEVFGQSKTRIASRLLVAAIAEALSLLPDDDVRLYNSYIQGPVEFSTRAVASQMIQDWEVVEAAIVAEEGWRVGSTPDLTGVAGRQVEEVE
jgi:hypothetical protein